MTNEIQTEGTANREIETAGDSRHPDHHAFIFALGEATFGASRLAGICFDILRVLDGQSSRALYTDPLGTLQTKVEALSKISTHPPGLDVWNTDLKAAITTRNDLIHALPVKNGLHRRRGKNYETIRNFYTVEDVEEARDEFNRLCGIGGRLLYFDDGAAVKAWYAAGGS